MGVVEISEFDKKILANANIIWDKGPLTMSSYILNKLKAREGELRDNVVAFKNECEELVKNPFPDKVKVTYNTQIQSFRGDLYHYVWLFKSQHIGAYVKLALRVDLNDDGNDEVIIGCMELPAEREERRAIRDIGMNQ